MQLHHIKRLLLLREASKNLRIPLGLIQNKSTIRSDRQQRRSRAPYLSQDFLSPDGIQRRIDLLHPEIIAGPFQQRI